MTTSTNNGYARVARADDLLSKRFGQLRSLDPDRDAPTPLSAIFDRTSHLTPEVRAAFAEGLASIVEAQAENFPDTIFWDVDAMAAAIATGPASDDPVAMSSLCAEITALQQQYGRNSILAFRYTHDFTYGFDWAKWMRRDPRARSEIGPFHPEFVAYLRERGRELVELIANDDEKYPKLPNGKPRNPFGFRRDLDDEATLFDDLARRDLLPVCGWDPTAIPRCDRPFADLREARAVALGIPTKPVGGA